MPDQHPRRLSDWHDGLQRHSARRFLETGPTNQLDLTNGYLYTAQLWAAPGDGVPESSLFPVLQYTTTLRTGASTNSAGFIVPLSFTATNPDPGIPYIFNGAATCQLRVWYNGGGAYANWETAQYSGVLSGASPLFSVDDLPGASDFPPNLPANISGLQSFNVTLPDAYPGPPFVYPQPEDLTVPLGGNAEFYSGADDALALQWTLNATNVNNTARISGAQAESLTVLGARLSDAGTYRLVAQNFSGAATSALATLTVTVTPPILTFNSLDAATGRLSFSAGSILGRYYQFQYKTSLAQSNWLNLGNPIVGTNNVVTASDFATNLQRFYRLVLMAQ